MCMYKTIYTVYTCRYTWKLTVQDFILSKIASLQVYQKMCFFTCIFQGNFNFLENPS